VEVILLGRKDWVLSLNFLWSPNISDLSRVLTCWIYRMMVQECVSHQTLVRDAVQIKKQSLTETWTSVSQMSLSFITMKNGCIFTRRRKDIAAKLKQNRSKTINVQLRARQAIKAHWKLNMHTAFRFFLSEKIKQSRYNSLKLCAMVWRHSIPLLSMSRE